MNWGDLYSAFAETEDKDSEIKKMTKQVEFADIGCGYGGLLSKIIIA